MSIRHNVEVVTSFTIDQAWDDSDVLASIGHYDTLEDAQFALPVVEEDIRKRAAARGETGTTTFTIVKVTYTVERTTERVPAL